MRERRKHRLKKFHFHPITTFILLTFGVMILSWLFSLLGVQASYSRVNTSTLTLESITVYVENMLNFDGLKYIISNAARNFVSFAPLSSLLVALIGVSIAHATGFIDTFIKRNTMNISNKKITFLLILLSVFSSLINDVGYVILIPLAALIFMANNRSPLLGIVTAFCGVAFGYGATLFIGSSEVNLIPLTTAAARVIDSSYHVSLSANLFILIVSTFIISVVGTVVIENIIVKKVGKYHKDEEDESTVVNLEEFSESDVQKRLETDSLERKGLKNAYIVAILVILLFIYMIIPGLPFSGMLLDMNESTYLRQLFGENSYFQDGFTYMMSILFLLCGLAYAMGAKTIKSDNDLIKKASSYLKDVGMIIVMIFFAAQFIAVFKMSNIGTVFVALGAELINTLNFTGVALILLVILVIAVSSFFIATPVSKWQILSPVVVPLLMQSNISPQFAQFILRAGDSIFKGLTPLLAYFVIYVAYLNVYNKDDKPITIRKAISYIYPYSIIVGITWILIVIGWYLIGVPLGPGVFATL